MQSTKETPFQEIYRSIVKTDSAATTKDEHLVHKEFTNQRAYMERALDALKTRVGRSEDKMRQDFQKKVYRPTFVSTSL